MLGICFYFQVHQPYRLRHYSYFDIGEKSRYEDSEANSAIMEKVASKCYLPMNNLLLELIERHKGRFKVAFSFSGTVLDQFAVYAPEVLASFQRLVNTECVEVLSETYNHSLAYLYSKEEFREQVALHRAKVQEIFGVTPEVFRNTELIYSNAIAKEVENMGYKAILAEGADNVLGWRSPNYVYRPQGCDTLKLLLKNYRLSDDIAFRFSNSGWPEFPLTAEKFASWVHAVLGQGEVINLFMDYETFGEHQWETTGIFQFMDVLPQFILNHPDTAFMTPSEAVASLAPVANLDVHSYMSWADAERDLTAWLGNDLQDDAISTLYSYEQAVKNSSNPALLKVWRNLQTSDHFYYMCTKWFSDGDVHKYFNPYPSPYDAYINYMNVLTDLSYRIDTAGHVFEPGLPRGEAPAAVQQIEKPEKTGKPAGPAAKGRAQKPEQPAEKGRVKKPENPGVEEASPKTPGKTPKRESAGKAPAKKAAPPKTDSSGKATATKATPASKAGSSGKSAAPAKKTSAKKDG
jgi:Alpha-amylase/alpha-mannosidase